MEDGLGLLLPGLAKMVPLHNPTILIKVFKELVKSQADNIRPRELNKLHLVLSIEN